MAERPISQEEKDRAAAEAVKALAEAERFHAETAKLLHEGRKAAAEADTAELALTAANRREAEELAGDKYYHLYRFTETVSSSSVKTCMDRLAFWHRTEPDCPIEVVFFSPGGDVIAGLVLFDYLQELRAGGHHLTTSALGWAASMAGILLQAGDERIMAREAWILIHEVSFGTGGTMGAVEDCVSPEMPVLTADLRWVPAGDLARGDAIVAFQETRTDGSFYRRWSPAMVTASDRGLRNCYAVDLTNGESLRVTDSHPFLFRNSNMLLRWRKAAELVSGRDMLSRLVPYERPANTWEAGFIAGLLDGDGTISRISRPAGKGKGETAGWRINFGQNKGATFNRFVNILKSDGFDVSVTPSKQEPFTQANIYGFIPSLRVLMRYRPPRLIERFWASFSEGPPAMVKGIEYEKVKSVRPIGPQEVVLLGTSTKTFIGQGYGMHNTVNWLKRIQDRVLTIFAERCKQAGINGTASKPLTKPQLERGWRRKDWWLDGPDCVRLGLVDRIR